MWLLTSVLGSRKGASWPISSVELFIGRDQDCDVVVRDRLVSRRHCSLWTSEQGVRLKDLESRNGLLVNGELLSEAMLQHGDELTIGSSIFVVERNGEGTQTTPSANMGATTHTLGLDDYKQHSSLLSPRPRNLSDLNLLHRLAMGLANCASTRSAETLVVETITRNIPVDTCRVIPISKGERKAPISSGSCATLSKKDDASALTDSGILRAANIGYVHDNERCEISMPLSIRNLPFASIMVDWRPASSNVSNPDIGLLLAIAQVSAPYLFPMDLVSPELAHNSSASGLEAFVGNSEVARRLRPLIERYAHVDIPALIVGETGTGKELIASAIHKLSDRQHNPFVVVNCAAIAETMFESQFFGHVKGAFTGADRARSGLMQRAHGGTLFLDEVADLSLENQARILRSIEGGAFRPLGSDVEVRVDLRIIAACNRNLLDLVADGKFRQDLYYRLSGIEVCTPPLRERPDDVGILFDHFAREYAIERGLEQIALSEDALTAMKAYEWPGNVRELRNIARRMSGLHPGKVIELADIGVALGARFKVPFGAEERITGLAATGHPSEAHVDVPAKSLDTLNAQHIERVLIEHNWRIVEAATALGIHRNTLRNKIKCYGLIKPGT